MRIAVDSQWAARWSESPWEMNGVRGAAGSFDERRMESTRENPG